MCININIYHIYIYIIHICSYMCVCVSLYSCLFVVSKSQKIPEDPCFGQASVKDTATPLHKKPEETLVIVQQHLKHQSTFRSRAEISVDDDLQVESLSF